LGQGQGPLSEYCTVLDTLEQARRLHPGQRNNLDALCKRYSIDNSQRELHGALLDAEILADVFLAMTGGQVTLSLEGSRDAGAVPVATVNRLDPNRPPLRVIRATAEEVARHHNYLEIMAKKNGGICVWTASGSGDAGGVP
jgi:DNA polymerase-3 subunit epsilon